MRDTRGMRTALAVGLAAAIGAIVGEMFVKPIVNKKVR